MCCLKKQDKNLKQFTCLSLILFSLLGDAAFARAGRLGGASVGLSAWGGASAGGSARRDGGSPPLSKKMRQDVPPTTPPQGRRQAGEALTAMPPHAGPMTPPPHAGPMTPPPQGGVQSLDSILTISPASQALSSAIYLIHDREESWLIKKLNFQSKELSPDELDSALFELREMVRGLRERRELRSFHRYIGRVSQNKDGKRDAQRRFKEHLRSALDENRRLYLGLRENQELGKRNQMTVLIHNVHPVQLAGLEAHLIQLFGGVEDLGWNSNVADQSAGRKLFLRDTDLGGLRFALSEGDFEDLVSEIDEDESVRKEFGIGDEPAGDVGDIGDDSMSFRGRLSQGSSVLPRRPLFGRSIDIPSSSGLSQVPVSRDGFESRTEAEQRNESRRLMEE